MIEIIIQLLKKDGWCVVHEEKNIVIYKTDKDGIQNPYETYMCDDNNMYRFFKGEMSAFASFESLENNLMGLFCTINNSRSLVFNQIFNDVNKIRSCKTIEEIKSIFLKYFDEKNLNCNLNLDTSVEKNDAFNLNVDGEWLSINLIKGDFYIPITEVNNQNELYAQLLSYMVLKEKFSKEIISMVSVDRLDDKTILELFSLYSDGSLTLGKQKKNKIK